MITILNTQGPEQPAARHSLDLVLSLVSVDCPCEVLFVGEGLLQLVSAARQPDLLKKYALLPDLFDFQDFYVLDTALVQHGLQTTQLRLPVQSLTPEAWQGKLTATRQRLVF